MRHTQRFARISELIQAVASAPTAAVTDGVAHSDCVHTRVLTEITRITSKMGRNAKIISNSFGIVPLSVVDVAEMDFLSNTLS